MTDQQRMAALLSYLASDGYRLETREDVEELAAALVGEGAAIPTRCARCVLHSSTRQPYDNTSVYCSHLRRVVPANHYCKIGYCKYPKF